MANQIPGVKDKIYKAAVKEFLSKGYNDASLREIAKNADTSTNSIYVRFKDKAGLFSAIVKPLKDKIVNMYKECTDEFESSPTLMSYEEMQEYTTQKMIKMIEELFENFDACKLLVCCSDGTEFSMWIDEMAEIDSEKTVNYINAIGSDAITSGRMTAELLHMLSSAYWSGVFEAFRHDMNKENVFDYVKKVKRFFACGWKDIIVNK